MKSFSLLQSNNIVRFYGSTIKKNRWIGLIMEFCPGGSLKDLVQNKTPDLPIVIAMKFLKEISDAVAFIHGQHHGKHAVHGDIKLDNILLSRSLSCKLSDFGTTQVLTMTSTVGMLGCTPMYAAPEVLKIGQYTGNTRQSDMFSVGVVVEFIITRNHKRVHPDRLSSIVENLKAKEDERGASALQALYDVHKATCIDNPNNRLSIKEVKRAIDSYFKKYSEVEVMLAVAKVLEEYNMHPLPEASQLVAPLEEVINKGRGIVCLITSDLN